jgi:hypothetical protein
MKLPSLIDVGNTIPPRVSKFVFEISLQLEGSGRPHKIVELCATGYLDQLTRKLVYGTANYALNYTGGSKSSFQGFASIFPFHMLFLDLTRRIS